MGTLVFFLALWGFCKALKAIRRAWANRPAYEPEQDEAEQENPVQRNLATLAALQAQRDELRQQLDLINGALDAAPPEKERLRWLKERTRAYGQMATVEAKISKLIG